MVGKDVLVDAPDGSLKLIHHVLAMRMMELPILVEEVVDQGVVLRELDNGGTGLCIVSYSLS